MTTPPRASDSLPASSASPRLLGAALAGLLCFGTTHCSTAQPGAGSGAAGTAGAGRPSVVDTASSAGQAATSEAGGADGSVDSATGGNEAGGSDETGGSNETGGTATTPVGGAGSMLEAGAPSSTGAGGAAPEPPHITSSQSVGVLTEDDFKALCDERGGSVEVMPHCGGFATAQGFSYDSTTELLSEHTCMGANTCAGWNCVIPD
jgi:hypothetical protein